MIEISNNPSTSQAGGSERNDNLRQDNHEVDNEDSASTASRAESAQHATVSDAEPELTVAEASTSLTELVPAATESNASNDVQLCTRKRARDGLVKQAERMMKRSRIVNRAGDIGDNVTIPIPMFDRGRGDPRNIIGIIVDRDENDMYRIAVRAGVLKGKYSRNQFDLCTQKLYVMEDVKSDAEVGLRQAVQHESVCGGQGFVKCNCTGRSRCEVNRCKCFKAGVKCNSRCHSNLTCNNKS